MQMVKQPRLRFYSSKTSRFSFHDVGGFKNEKFVIFRADDQAETIPFHYTQTI